MRIPLARSMTIPNEHHQNPHAIFFAYPLQGHVIPSIHLAIKLASRGFTITFINTQSIHHQIARPHERLLLNKNITNDKNTVTTCGGGEHDDNIFAAVREAGLDIRYTTVSDGLPLELDRSLNHDQFMFSLLHVYSAHVEEAVKKIVRRSNPAVTCLIADTFFVWPSVIAKKFGLPYVSFWTEPALVFTLYYHMDLLRKHGHFACNDIRQDPIQYVPGVNSIEPKDMMSYLQDTDTSSVCHQIISKAFNDVRAADFVLCNTIQELEPQTISALNSKIPFYAIGPIFPDGFTKSIVATSLWSESNCTQWLDTKPNASVLYVSFGSYAHVTKQDLAKIANGLMLSEVSFIWVLRPDIVSSDDADPLPAGFREQVSDRAMIIAWCCQIQVLSHPAVGGFLTHCGWNSTLESIWCKIPLLCFPLLTDQFTNRKLVVDDWKIGINLNDRRLITKEEVSERIKYLMNEQTAEEIKANILVVRNALQDAWTTKGSSEMNITCFIKDLQAKAQLKKM